MDEAGWLRVYTPTGERLLSHEEAERARQEAEARAREAEERAQSEAQARATAEAELDHLRAELARFRAAG